MKDAATAPVKSKGCSVALMAVKEPAWTKQQCNSGGAPLLFPTAFYPTLKRGRYPFTAVFFLKMLCTSCVLNPGPSAPVTNALTTWPPRLYRS